MTTNSKSNNSGNSAKARLTLPATGTAPCVCRNGKLDIALGHGMRYIVRFPDNRLRCQTCGRVQTTTTVETVEQS